MHFLPFRPTKVIDFVADFLIQSGFASQVRFHGKRYPWFVSDVTKKDWEWLLNIMVYGQLFSKVSEEEKESLKRLGRRWKQYEKEGKWVYEQHPFWCTGYTYWDLHSEAPDLFLHLSRSDLVIFKGDLNHRKVRSLPPIFLLNLTISPINSSRTIAPHPRQPRSRTPLGLWPRLPVRPGFVVCARSRAMSWLALARTATRLRKS